MKRRKISLLYAVSMATPTLLLTPRRAEAIWPLSFILRLVLGGAFRSTATRTVTNTAARALAGGATRTVVTSFQTVGTLGISATGLATVSAAVWALAKEHNVKQIWVAGDEAANRFQLISDKANTEPQRIFVGYRVVNVVTGAVETSATQVAYAMPGNKPMELPFLVKPLPHIGLKRIEAFVTLDDKGLHPHPNFAVASPQLVVVADPSEVKYA